LSTRLVLLGLLRERPLHGYELKQIIEEEMGDWTSIAFGSIYFALKKMSQEGLIEKVATEQEGNRPSRSIYQITPEGQAAFLSLLREVWGHLERQYFQIDIGLGFIDALPRYEIVGYLQARIGQLSGTLAHLDHHEREQMQNPHIPAYARAVFSHSRIHMQAELDWTRELLAQIERGAFDR